MHSYISFLYYVMTSVSAFMKNHCDCSNYVMEISTCFDLMLPQKYIIMTCIVVLVCKCSGFPINNIWAFKALGLTNKAFLDLGVRDLPINFLMYNILAVLPSTWTLSKPHYIIILDSSFSTCISLQNMIVVKQEL